MTREDMRQALENVGLRIYERAGTAVVIELLEYHYVSLSRREVEVLLHYLQCLLAQEP